MGPATPHVEGTDGNFYGTTSYGGNDNCGVGTFPSTSGGPTGFVEASSGTFMGQRSWVGLADLAPCTVSPSALEALQHRQVL